MLRVVEERDPLVLPFLQPLGAFLKINDFVVSLC